MPPFYYYSLDFLIELLMMMMVFVERISSDEPVIMIEDPFSTHHNESNSVVQLRMLDASRSSSNVVDIISRN